MKWEIDIAPWKLEYGLQSPGFALPNGAEERGAPEPFEVTDEQRRALIEDGAVVIPGLLSPEWLAYLRDVTEWQVANPHVWSVAGVASGLYDYIQRSVWASNSDFAKFMYYSPLASALAGVSGAEELRLATDLLMVNPNKGFKWHQDNQNGPIDAFGGGLHAEDEPHKALRWWVTMDDTPPDHGAPVYLKVRANAALWACPSPPAPLHAPPPPFTLRSSHSPFPAWSSRARTATPRCRPTLSLLTSNATAYLSAPLRSTPSRHTPPRRIPSHPCHSSAHSLSDPLARRYPELLEFRPKAGDLIVWHARAIHKIDGPADQDWGQSKRRVLGGTVACNKATYESMGRALFSDMGAHAVRTVRPSQHLTRAPSRLVAGSHGLVDGDPLDHPLFPRIYPSPIPHEMEARQAGKCTRTMEGMSRLAGNIASSAGEMLSFTKVTNK